MTFDDLWPEEPLDEHAPADDDEEQTTPLRMPASDPYASDPRQGQDRIHQASIARAQQTPGPGRLQLNIDSAAQTEPDNPDQQATAVLPEDFWSARPVLKSIREIAHSRGVSADTVFHVLLARLAAQAPPKLRVETDYGKPASLNMMVAVVGPSGTNKSLSAGVAKDRLVLNRNLLDFQDNLPLGTGEGIAEAFMGTVEIDTGETKKNGDPITRTERVQDKHNAFFYLDEGETLFKILERKGSTLGATLRTAWTGGTIGNQNATKENNRKADDYCLGLVIGFQEETALPLLRDYVAGTPQRFLWCDARDPNIPRLKPPDVDTIIDWDWQGLHELRQIDVDRGIKNWIWNYHWMRNTGQMEVDPQDSHQVLMLVKVSALLAILDRRVTVTPEDWALAEMVYGHSRTVRGEVHKKAAEQETARLRAKEEETRRMAVADQEGRDEVQERHARSALSRSVAFICRTPQGAAKKDIKRSLGSRLRDHVDGALEQAAETGSITLRDDRWYCAHEPSCYQ